MKRQFIKDLYENTAEYAGKTVTLGGWVRNLRDSKAFGFIDLNDGSYFKSAQVVFEREKISNYDEIAKQNIGAPRPAPQARYPGRWPVRAADDSRW